MKNNEIRVSTTSTEFLDEPNQEKDEEREEHEIYDISIVSCFSQLDDTSHS
jgi:hypothetical protein